MRIMGVAILTAFYTIYFAKMAMQHRRGIRTNQIARGKTKGRLYYVELVMKIATYAAVAVEVASIIWGVSDWPMPVRVLGVIIGALGVAVFAAAVVTMRDSWRAGIALEEKTEMVTRGIYRWSRNPAFLGFDCVYLGLILMFFNWPLLIVSGWAAAMLHLQILQEERYLAGIFGEEYVAYRNRVGRYLGQKFKRT